MTLVSFYLRRPTTTIATTTTAATTITASFNFFDKSKQETFPPFFQIMGKTLLFPL